MKTVVAEVSLLGKIASYIEILVKDPHSTVFVSLCDVYRKLGLIEEALATARKGVAAVPEYVPGYVILGRMLAEQKDLLAAADAFEQALALDQEHVSALTGLARVRFLLGDVTAARSLLQKATALAPDDAFVAKMLAGLPPQAIASNTPVVRASIPLDSITTHAEPSVIETEQLVESKPPIATATLADIYVQQGFLDKALKVYMDILQAEPDNKAIQIRYEALKQQLNSVVAPLASFTGASQVVGKENMSGLQRTEFVYQSWLRAIDARRTHV